MGDLFENGPVSKPDFEWTKFYEAVAKRLLDFKDDRRPLADIFQRVKNEGNGELQDVCPFTVMALFNRGPNGEGQNYDKRRGIARALAEELRISEEPPSSFRGIPTARGLLLQFFSVTHGGDANVAALWRVFVAADVFANNGDANAKVEFQKSYSAATQIPLVSWNLSFGLFWAHPYFFVSLSTKSRKYISTRLVSYIHAGIPPSHAPWPSSGPLNVDDYLQLRQDLSAKLEDSNFPVHSFPELAWEAWSTPSDSSTEAESEDEEDDAELESDAEGLRPEPADGASRAGVENEAPASEQTSKPPRQDQKTTDSYTIKDILKDCFHSEGDIKSMLECLKRKKNLILQGPPGTGKTWLAKRLAYLVIKRNDDERVCWVQFHPGTSYEDFVRGWRPNKDGKLEIVDGVFLKSIRDANSHSDMPYVVVIEEINRGNPAQIFGELLTLLEADKRKCDCGLQLTYPSSKGNYDPVFIPDNLYVIGTMNLADRSLAAMDHALRRRFAFCTLEPKFDAWCDWVAANCGIEPGLAKDICGCLTKLNEQIVADENLGKQCCIGHSFVTPPKVFQGDAAKKWLRGAVETEIRPQLEEYWLDALPKDVNEQLDALKTYLS